MRHGYGLAFAGLLSAPMAAQAPTLIVSGSGRVFGTPSATTARIGFASSDAVGMVDAGTGTKDASRVTANLTGALPVFSNSALVLNAGYQGVAHEAAGALRVEHETASGLGLWVGARYGAARVDSLGLDPWTRGASAIVLPVRGPSVSGPAGFGGGLWADHWGVVFGASVTTGTAGVRDQHVSQHWGADSIPGDSTTGNLVSDTTITNRTATGWLGRLSAAWATSRLSLDVSAGISAQPNAPRVGWAGATMALRVFTPVALVIATGTRGASTLVPIDPRRERAYVTGGLSVGWPSTTRRIRSSASDVRYRLEARLDGGYTLVIRAPWARTVDVMGDMTGWTIEHCEHRDDNSWALRRVLMPGVHRLVLRIDDGPWMVPPGASRSLNEYGDVVGVIVAGSPDHSIP